MEPLSNTSSSRVTVGAGGLAGRGATMDLAFSSSITFKYQDGGAVRLQGQGSYVCSAAPSCHHSFVVLGGEYWLSFLLMSSPEAPGWPL